MGNAEVFDVRAWEGRDFLPTVAGSHVEIFGADEIADTAALVGFRDAGPEAVKLLLEQFGFVKHHGSAGDEIEDGAVGACDGRKKLPPGKNVEATGANGGFHNFF